MQVAPFVFPEMGYVDSVSTGAKPIPAHYREAGLWERRSDVTEKRFFSVENSGREGLVSGGSALAADISGFRYPESQSPPFFQPGHG